jgi:acid phosphatase (class A)
MRRGYLALSLSLSLCGAALVAAPTMAQTDAAAAKPPHFLLPGALDLQALLPAPPAADAPETRSELDELLQLQTARTPAQAARCIQIEGEDIWLFGSEVLGPWFNAANLPQTAAFFAAVRNDFIPVNRAAKAVWPRRRPPFADARVVPCVEFSDSGAYPSGHGIQSSMWAGLLAAIFPDQAAGFERRAQETLRYKLLSGVHYASDLRAGRVVGEALAQEFLKNPAVQKLVGELRVEAAPHRPN